MESQTVDPPVSPVSDGGPQALLSGAWTTEGFCQMGSEGQGTGGGGGDPIVRFTEGWVTCGCPAGMEMVDNWVDWPSQSSGITCACSNGSTEPDCLISGSPPGGQDPPDPGDGPGGGGQMPPDTVRFRLECDASVERGQEGGCAIVVSPSHAQVSNIKWESLVFDVAPEQQGGMTWRGPMVVPTEVRVTATVSGSGLVLQNVDRMLEIEVEERDWSWDNNTHLSKERAAPGQFDACIQSLAQTVGTDCEAGGSGALFTPYDWERGTVRDAPPSGPNSGIWYVESVSAGMHVRSQIRVDFRSDAPTDQVVGNSQVLAGCLAALGSPIPPQNMDGVNVACMSAAAFTELIEFAWDHEEEHMDAALDAARQPANDLHAVLETLVGGDVQAAFEWDLSLEWTAVNDRIVTASLGIHTGAHTDFPMWVPAGAGVWVPGYVRVHH